MYLTGKFAMMFTFQKHIWLITYFEYYMYRVLHAQSNSGKLKAVIHSIASDDPKTKTKYFLEIWSDEKLLQSFDLCALNLHGPVYTDGELILFNV